MLAKLQVFYTHLLPALAQVKGKHQKDGDDRFSDQRILSDEVRATASAHDPALR